MVRKPYLCSTTRNSTNFLLEPPVCPFLDFVSVQTWVFILHLLILTHVWQIFEIIILITIMWPCGSDSWGEKGVRIHLSLTTIPFCRRSWVCVDAPPTCEDCGVTYVGQASQASLFPPEMELRVDYRRCCCTNTHDSLLPAISDILCSQPKYSKWR